MDGLEAALDGLPTPAAGALPKKSKPISDSCGRAGFGCAGGGAVLVDFGGSVVAGLAGGSRSPNKSTLEAGRGCARGVSELACNLCDADLSIFAFSCTIFNGTSSSASRVEGSGIVPSMTHLLDSYFVRMKFSILASEGAWPIANLASQYLFALVLPHFKNAL